MLREIKAYSCRKKGLQLLNEKTSLCFRIKLIEKNMCKP